MANLIIHTLTKKRSVIKFRYCFYRSFFLLLACFFFSKGHSFCNLLDNMRILNIEVVKKFFLTLSILKMDNDIVEH